MEGAVLIPVSGTDQERAHVVDSRLTGVMIYLTDKDYVLKMGTGSNGLRIGYGPMAVSCDELSS
jgi:hypothetical protein